MRFDAGRGEYHGEMPSRPLSEADGRPGGRPRRRGVVIAMVVLVVAVVGGGLLATRLVPERYVPWNTVAFPDVDRGALTPLQGHVLNALEEQYRDPQPGEFYSEGVDQAWCANFVSWIMARVDAPYANPHSGHWRIPGVLTLQDYFVGEGRFTPADTNYLPRTGDVVLYISPVVGEHTNMIVSVDPETRTAITLGGNETGAVRLHRLRWQDDSAVIGFGHLPGG